MVIRSCCQQPSGQTEPRNPKGENNMNTIQPLKKMVVGALLSGGVALAGLGLTAGTAGAAPANPGPTIDPSDFGTPVVECIQCQRTFPATVLCESTPDPSWAAARYACPSPLPATERHR